VAGKIWHPPINKLAGGQKS